VAASYRIRNKTILYRLLAVFWILSLLLLSGCEARRDNLEVTQEVDPLSNVTITGQLDDAPAGCTPEQVAGRLQGLFSAISSRDRDLVPEYFGPFEGQEFTAQRGQYFQWYCMGGDDIYDLPDLEQYFIRRFRRDEELQLVSIDVNGWDQARDLVDFSVIGERRANDLPGDWHQIGGKGAYNCEYQTFQLLCMGDIPFGSPYD
jgi:hypothetical protein